MSSPPPARPAGLRREVLPSPTRHVQLSLVEVAGPSHEIEPQAHLRLSLNIGPRFVIDAQGPQGRQRFDNVRHSLMVIPPETTVLHEAGLPKPAGRPYVPVRLATFRISAELSAQAAMAMGLPSSRSRLEHQVIPPDEVLRGAALALLADLREGCPDGAAATEALASALLQRVYARQLRSGPSATADVVARVQAHMDEHLQEEVSLERLATLAGLSRYHLCRVFRRVTGATPHQYLLTRRLEHAKRLLWEAAGRERSMVDVALQCGFASSSHFSVQFKKNTGMTPLQWQRQARR